MRLLVVRPQPGADATAQALRALGHDPCVVPLLCTHGVDWAPPAAPPDAVLMSSAAAARLAGPIAEPFKALPLLAVGDATAAAARAAGWADVRPGPGTLQALLDAAAAGPFRRLLHLAGEDRTPVRVPAALVLDVAIVYRAVLQPLPMLPDVDGVLLHSPRTARHFAAEWDRLGGQRAAVMLHTLSPAVAAAAGDGWRGVAVAARPHEDALLALLPKAG
jgi:uroporphyrinogen-III synthase